MKVGTVIPAHTHPVDEFVYVISGTIKTGGWLWEKRTFWKAPAKVRQGPHVALTDVVILTKTNVEARPLGEVFHSMNSNALPS